MKITKVNYRLKAEDDHTRSKGIHLSDLVRVLALKFGHLKPEYENAEINPELISLGRAWEDYIGPRHKDMLYHPGEKYVDKVYGTCDGISFTGPGEQLRVHEIKLTWLSSKHPVEDKWMWLTQIMGYCYMWETRWARLHRYHVMGKYDYDTTCQRYFVDDIEFTKREIDENWRMLMGAKQYLKDGLPKQVRGIIRPLRVGKVV